MKLKYYMRGLGIGIILSATILSISFHASSKPQLSDEEIMKRAEELGMVRAEEQNFSLDGLLKPSDGPEESDKQTIADAGQTEEEANTVEEQTSDIMEEQTSDIMEEQTREDTSDQAAETEGSTEEDTAADTGNLAEKDTTDVDEVTAQGTVEEAAEDEAPVPKTVTVEIKKGMTSEKVAELLKAQGVIKESGLFNQYLISHGYAGIIDYGSFELPVDASYEQIVDVIIK